jgi:hypothetical protein
MLGLSTLVATPKDVRDNKTRKVETECPTMHRRVFSGGGAARKNILLGYEGQAAARWCLLLAAYHSW